MTGARWIAAVAVALAGLPALGAPATAAVPVPLQVAAARLSGDYTAAGVVTQAVGVAGEHRGQRIQRSWSFISPCPTGACPILGLRRQRAAGADPMFLSEVTPGLYTGIGTFDAPLRCHGRVYRHGSTVPYAITIQIVTAAPQPDGSVLATAFAASYSNLARIGHTRCFSPPSYDSARYLGVRR